MRKSFNWTVGFLLDEKNSNLFLFPFNIQIEKDFIFRVVVLCWFLQHTFKQVMLFMW